MEANAAEMEITPHATSTSYSSRPGALIWSFRKSRDRWKSKHQTLKASVKQDKNRVADLTKSREQWRLKAEQATTRLATLEAEIATLRAEAASHAEGKKIPRPPRS
jgi:chromosome segregation ATPase